MKTDATEIEPPILGDVEGLAVYSPSWIDRLAGAIERMRMPYWLTCLLLFIFELLLIHAISWLDGTTPFPGFRLVFINLPLWTWGSLALIIHLDHVSVEALRKFRPQLPVDEIGYQKLVRRLTTMPARPLLASSIIFVLLFLVFVYVFPLHLLDLFRGRSFNILVGIAAIGFPFGGAFYYHIWHQLREISHLYHRSKPFDLFNSEQIFAFSKVTSISSVALIFFLASSLTMAVPVKGLDFGIIVFQLVGVPLALAVFITPLWGAHARLTTQKRELQTNAEQRMKDALASLNSALQANDLTSMDLLNKTLNNLVIERDVLARLPTWPWRPGTVTGVVSAIMLPTLLLILQIIIQRWFTP